MGKADKFFVVTVPVSYNRDGEDVTEYRRVGAAFANTSKSGGQYLRLKLDYPVGATEFLCFINSSLEADRVAHDGINQNIDLGDPDTGTWVNP